MSKELWIKVREAFIEDHGRDPSDSEMQKAYAEACGDTIDSVDLEC